MRALTLRSCAGISSCLGKMEVHGGKNLDTVVEQDLKVVDLSHVCKTQHAIIDHSQAQ